MSGTLEPGRHSNIPVPDPSLLTTDQLRRELYALRELVEARAQTTNQAIDHLRELSTTLAGAGQSAIKVALDAQKDAAASRDAFTLATMAKSDATTTKQIDNIGTLLANSTGQLNDKITVINGRLDRGEGGNQASTDKTASFLAIAGLVVSIVVAIFVGLGLVVSSRTGNNQQQPYPYYSSGSPDHSVVTISPPLVTGKPPP